MRYAEDSVVNLIVQFQTLIDPVYSIGWELIAESDAADIALRMLEIMAYTFNRYSSRECPYREFFHRPAGREMVNLVICACSFWVKH